MTALTYDERQDLVTAVYRAECDRDRDAGTVALQRAHLELLFGLPRPHAAPTCRAHVGGCRRRPSARARAALAMIVIQGLETIPEIGRRRDLLAQARVAMRDRDFVRARRLCDEADRAALARTRLAARREREA